MSALSFARQVFNPEKPHSSITDWVDILTVSSIEEEAYDGIPELVESINLQGSTGPAEASRALRKKLKHGNPHQQYRALVILKALVENCGDKFRHTFADNQLVDAFRVIAADNNGDKRVQKKLKLVLLSWQEQFKSDPSMKNVADLYWIIKDNRKGLEEALYVGPTSKAEKEEFRRKREEAKEKEREMLRKREEERKRKRARTRRQAFNFEEEKPKVLASIAEASQASSNLVNAITLVNPEKESILTNERVQNCLEIAKQVRKNIVSYVQLVEDEEMIGVLIETNDRIIAALDLYDQAQGTLEPKVDTKEITSGLARTHLGGSTGELARLQDQQRAEVEKAKHSTSPFEAYPDLQDLDFAASSSKLPPPIRPTSMEERSDEQGGGGGGTLSDFSDYESSDEETHNNRAWSGSENKKDYITVSDDSDDARIGIRKHAEEENPFADPFADQVAIGSSKHM